MITLTLGQVLDDNDRTEPEDAAVIYVIRDHARALYVGMSTWNLIDRIWDHCGLGSRGGIDQVGRWISKHMPQALGWPVDFLTVDDCQAITGRELPIHLGHKAVAHQAELAIMRHYKPVLNILNNQRAH